MSPFLPRSLGTTQQRRDWPHPNFFQVNAVLVIQREVTACAFEGLRVKIIQIGSLHLPGTPVAIECLRPDFILLWNAKGGQAFA